MSSDKLSFGTKLSYRVGDVASNVFIVTTGMYLLFFLTDTLGVHPALAGTALLFALGCTAFTVINVPYSSMVAEMSADYNERMSLTSFRMIFASVGALVAGALVRPLVAIGGGGAAGYRFMGLVYAAVMVLTGLICFWGTRNAPVFAQREVMPPFKEQVRIAFRNTAFVMLGLSYFFQALAIGVMMAGFVYYVKYVMALSETAMNVVYPVSLVTAIVLLGAGFSSFQLFPFSMLPDTIEYDQMQSGMRREGVFSAIVVLASFVPFGRYNLTQERFEEIKRRIANPAAP